MDLSAVAHLAAIKGRVPFLNFFDGFRTSHEVQKIAVLGLRRSGRHVRHGRREGLPRPCAQPRASALCAAATRTATSSSSTARPATAYYDALPAVVEEYMDKVNAKLGTDYQLFNYYGAPDAERVIVAMGSICDVAEEVIDYLNAQGEKVGLVKVRLYRPFVAEQVRRGASRRPARRSPCSTAPRSPAPRRAAVPGRRQRARAMRAARASRSSAAATAWAPRTRRPRPCSPSITELAKDEPQRRVHHRHRRRRDRPVPARGRDCSQHRGRGHHRVQVLGSGRRRHRRREQELHQDHRRPHRQVRAGLLPVRLEEDRRRDHQPPALRRYAHPAAPTTSTRPTSWRATTPATSPRASTMVKDVKPGGTFMINCQWTPEELEQHLSAEAKRYIANNDIQLYTINAIDLAMRDRHGQAHQHHPAVRLLHAGERPAGGGRHPAT